MPIDGYVVDFICRDAKLIVEVGGSQHMNCERDVVRTKVLENAGFFVLRFWNNDVLTNEEGVLVQVQETL